jgi:hypothetical protein
MALNTHSTQRGVAEKLSKGIRTMKTIALLAALAFAAPLAAQASPSVAQLVQQTYHTSFPAAK